MPSADDLLEELLIQVRSSEKYRSISPHLIRDLGKIELSKRSSLKEAVKCTRSKLHQIGGAYQEKTIPYAKLTAELQQLPHAFQDPQSQEFCRRTLAAHASSRERLSMVEYFFNETLASIAPLHSVLDLAGGLNPLALPWMPVAQDFSYYTCDIYEDLSAFLNAFFSHFGIQGGSSVVDLSSEIPQQPVQVAFLLKTIPCLEQIGKGIGRHLLEGLNAENILVSFPAHSLGGRSKGMVQNYENHFNELVQGKNWKIQRFQFASELAFLIQK